MRISDWSSDVCSSDLSTLPLVAQPAMPPAKSVENTVVAPAVDHSASDSTIEPTKTGSFMPAYLLAWDGGQQHAAPRPPVRDSANPGSSMGPAPGLVTARRACAAAAPPERQSVGAGKRG